MATLAVACVALGARAVRRRPRPRRRASRGSGGVAPAAMAVHAGPAARRDRRRRADVAAPAGARARAAAGARSPGAPARWAPTGGCAWATHGAAAASARRRAWSTPRPPSPSRCGASSPSCTGRPGTCPSTSIRTSKYFVQSIEYRSEIHPWFERVLYDSAACALLRAAATWVRRLQGGSVHLYLALHDAGAPGPAHRARWRGGVEMIGYVLEVRRRRWRSCWRPVWSGWSAG